VQEARKPTETVLDRKDGYFKPGGMDGIDIAKSGLFKVCDYEEQLRIAKTERRNRRLAKHAVLV
jgi:hypothetical protein